MLRPPVVAFVQGVERKSFAFFVKVLQIGSLGNKRGLGTRASSLVAVGMRVDLSGCGLSYLHSLLFHIADFRRAKVIILNAYAFVKEFLPSF